MYVPYRYPKFVLTGVICIEKALKGSEIVFLSQFGINDFIAYS